MDDESEQESQNEKNIETKPLVEQSNRSRCSKSILHRIGFGIVIAAIAVVVVFELLLRQGCSSDECNDDDEDNNDPLVVNTQYGKVKGFYLSSPTWLPSRNISNFVSDTPHLINTTVRAWRGIPFARPPVGPLRWKSPEEPQPYPDDGLDCFEHRSPCIQANDGSGSEDCLYLNIYSSDPDVDSSLTTGPWPVLFYIYGGGLMAGSATDNFNGLIYSDHEGHSGLVVVEVAYRVNLFGFLATNELSLEQGGYSGNYGIQDQILALKWVQKNIAKFNGDPSNVILNGQSSGGTSIFALLSSPQSAGLFSGGLSMSGSPNITVDLITAQRQNAVTVNNSGCNIPGFDYKEINSCMRNLTSSQVYEIIPNYAWNTPGMWGLPIYGGMDYQGIVIVDGKTITKPFTDALADGVVDVPLIFGNMACEPDEDPDNKVSNFTMFQWQKLLNESFQQWGGEAGLDIYNLYLDDASVNPQKAYDAIVSDYGLYCGQIEIAKMAMSSGGRKSPVYLYYDEWALSKPFVSGNGSYEVKFPFHDVFYFELTNQWPRIGNGSYVPTSNDLAAQAVIQRNFWSFLRLGRPTNDWLPVVNQAGTSSYSVFSINPDSSASYPNYRENVCGYLSGIGLTSPTFWWVN